MHALTGCSNPCIKGSGDSQSCIKVTPPAISVGLSSPGYLSEDAVVTFTTRHETTFRHPDGCVHLRRARVPEGRIQHERSSSWLKRT